MNYYCYYYDNYDNYEYDVYEYESAIHLWFLKSDYHRIG